MLSLFFFSFTSFTCADLGEKYFNENNNNNNNNSNQSTRYDLIANICHEEDNKQHDKSKEKWGAYKAHIYNKVRLPIPLLARFYWCHFMRAHVAPTLSLTSHHTGEWWMVRNSRLVSEDCASSVDSSIRVIHSDLRATVVIVTSAAQHTARVRTAYVFLKPRNC